MRIRLLHIAILADLTVVGVTWPPLNTIAKLKEKELLNTYLEALRKLAPDTGGYINEVCSNLHMDFVLGADLVAVLS